MNCVEYRVGVASLFLFIFMTASSVKTVSFRQIDYDIPNRNSFNNYIRCDKTRITGIENIFSESIRCRRLKILRQLFDEWILK